MSNPIRNHRIRPLKTYPNTAASFVAASSQTFSIADNASLSLGAVEMTAAGWVWLDVTTGNPGIMSKYSTAPNLEYILFYASASNAFRWQVTNNGTTAFNQDATTFGAATAGTWNWIVVNDNGSQMQISVNNGAFNTRALVGTIFDGNSAFKFGANDGGIGFLNGRLDSWGFWKSAVGSGGLLTAAQLTTLYNAGVGMAYKDLSADLKANLQAWWNFDGDGTDASGNGNNLTANNGVTYTVGKR